MLVRLALSNTQLSSYLPRIFLKMCTIKLILIFHLQETLFDTFVPSWKKNLVINMTFVTNNLEKKTQHFKLKRN